jgi:hypothetical protein
MAFWDSEFTQMVTIPANATTMVIRRMVAIMGDIPLLFMIEIYVLYLKMFPSISIEV